MLRQTQLMSKVSLPLTLTEFVSTFTVTPSRIVIGFLATLDI